MMLVTPTTDPGYLLPSVGDSVRSELKRLLARWQLRPLQFHILSALNAETGLSHGQLRELLGITNAHLVSLLDGLRAMDYATRTPDHDYHPRRYLVTITPFGRDVLAEASRAVDEYMSSFLSPLSQAELHQLTAILAKLLEPGQPSDQATPVAADRSMAWP
jgi:DNA-binding MarR family transcriptional regulator